jgi:hypothetical protein
MKKKGRPTRQQASAKALKALLASGIDPSNVDPRAILAAIAVDASCPASARVAACRALMADGAGKAVAGEDAPNELSRRAIQLLGRVGGGATN